MKNKKEERKIVFIFNSAWQIHHLKILKIFSSRRNGKTEKSNNPIDLHPCTAIFKRLDPVNTTYEIKSPNQSIS